jgi:hypothetical protein
MRFMNDWDIAAARSRYGQGITPNRLALTFVVDNLADWTNQHSDGWAYWPKPCRAASKAIALIDSTTNAENDRRASEDITHAEMVAAVRPIKAFLTRHASIVSNSDREIILRAVSS